MAFLLIAFVLLRIEGRGNVWRQNRQTKRQDTFIDFVTT